MRNILQDVVKKFIFLSKYTHRFLIGRCHDTVCLACDVIVTRGATSKQICQMR